MVFRQVVRSCSVPLCVPEGQLVSSGRPGGYFHGMVQEAKAGELNLVRTIWGLRQAKATRVRAGRPMH